MSETKRSTTKKNWSRLTAKKAPYNSSTQKRSYKKERVVIPKGFVKTHNGEIMKREDCLEFIWAGTPTERKWMKIYVPIKNWSTYLKPEHIYHACTPISFRDEKVLVQGKEVLVKTPFQVSWTI